MLLESFLEYSLDDVGDGNKRWSFLPVGEAVGKLWSFFPVGGSCWHKRRPLTRPDILMRDQKSRFWRWARELSRKYKASAYSYEPFPLPATEGEVLSGEALKVTLNSLQEANFGRLRSLNNLEWSFRFHPEFRRSLNNNRINLLTMAEQFVSRN